MFQLVITSDTLSRIIKTVIATNFKKSNVKFSLG